ncbi:MAG: hypothetical protein JWL65_3193 [Gammaproteobacteria bacterium]|nr:hypothetical protein [Gammaproteobacteria bacterium]
MADTAIKLGRAEFRPARAYDARARVSPDPIHNPTFAEAQSKACEWADKAIDLYQVGDTEQTRHAVRLAEVWLARMHAFEPTFRNRQRSTIEPESCTTRTESGTRDSAGVPVRPLLVVASPAASPLIANHIGTRMGLLSRRGR